MRTVSEVHKDISRRAAAIANEMVDRDPMFGSFSIKGNVFSSAASYSKKRADHEAGIAIRFNIDLNHIPDGDILQDGLHHIGNKAIQQALGEMGQEFAALIVGDAQAGRNYFDHFKP